MDTTTALAIIIPNEYHNMINSIREKYDRAYPRWPPHINFLFPFVPIEQFDNIISRLGPKLNSFNNFELTLDDIGYFKSGKNATVHIKPKDPSKLKELFNIITEVLPEVKQKHDEFNPHLTIGQIQMSKVDDFVKEMKSQIPMINFKVSNVCLLNRSKNDNNVPFSINKYINLN